MVNSDTLKALRQCWLQYFDPKTTAYDRRAKFHRAAATANKRKKELKHDKEVISSLTSQFGPLAEQSVTVSTFHANITCDFGCECSNIPETEYLNPLFAFSIGSGHEFSINARSSCLMGFHLAASIAPLASDSIHGMLKRTDNDILKVKLLAWLEFNEWCASFKKFNKSSRLRLRFFVGDPIALCYTFDQLNTGILSNMLSSYVQPWSGTPLVIDGIKHFGNSPLVFNVVDAANLTDTIGSLNLLVSVIPILERSPAAILHTDMKFNPEKGESETALLSRFLHGDPRTICTLLGIAPLPLLTGVTTRGYQNDLYRPSNRHYHRISWKLTASGDSAASNVKLACDPKELASVFAAMYLDMYPHQGERAEFEPPLDPPELGFGRIYNPPHYTKRGFAAFLAFLKHRILLDWESLMQKFLFALGDQLLNDGVHGFHIQDQLLQLYLAGTDPHVRKFSTNREPPGAVIPSSAVSCIVLSVPRAKLQPVLERYPVLEAKFNHRINLFLRIRLMAGRPEKGEDFLLRFNKVQLFSSAIPIFGKLVAAPDGKSCSIEADPKGWKGSSDLQVCTYVPTRSLETMREGPAPQIDLQVNPDNGSVLAMGGVRAYLDIHEAPLFDRTQVLLVESVPGLSAPRPKFIESPREEWSLYDDSATTPSFQTSNMTFTSRLTLRQESNNTVLASGRPVTVTESSPCSINISCQDYQYRFMFPYPIIARRANIRVNRQAGWIEITVPLASNKDGGYTENPFPAFGPIDAICNWNMPTVSFKTLAKIDLTKKTVGAWVIKHVGTMFSKREHQLLKANPQVNVPGITLFKKSLYDLFVNMTRSPRQRCYIIKAHADDTTSVIMVVSALYLNDTANSIVAEAYVVPFSEMPPEFGAISVVAVKIVVGTEAFKLWKQALPAMVERCRNWDHMPDCSRSSSSTFVGWIEESKDSLCLCAPLDRYLLPSLSRCNAHDRPEKGTPAAISPIFGTPYLEEMRDRDGMDELESSVVDLRIGSGVQGNAASPNGHSEPCNRCGKVAKKQCANCETVKYCSRGCQAQDWKEHKKVCASSKRK